MKRILIGLALIFSLALPARGENIALFTNLQASGTFGCGVDASGNALPCDLNGFSRASFQVSSTAGSTATVKLQYRNTANDPWGDVVTVINPGINELAYYGPGVGQVQCVVQWVGGSLNGTLVRTK